MIAVEAVIAGKLEFIASKLDIIIEASFIIAGKVVALVIIGLVVNMAACKQIIAIDWIDFIILIIPFKFNFGWGIKIAIVKYALIILGFNYLY